MGAGIRRAAVYLIAGVLVVVAGLIAVRFAQPEDPYDDVAVQRVGGSGENTRTEAVRWDSEQGRGMIDVRESDGVVRRYYMQSDDEGDMRVWGGREAPSEDEVQEPPEEQFDW